MNKTREEFDRFCVVMWGVAEDFGGKLSKEGLKMRFNALYEFSIDQITEAGTWLLKNRKEKFPAVPTTKEFIDAIQKVSGENSPKVKAELEADKVFKKLKEWGRDAEPKFYDEISKYLMTHRWTFQELANKTADDLKWFRKDFVSAYVEMAESEVETENLLPGGIDDPDRISAKRLNLLVHTKSVED